MQYLSPFDYWLLIFSGILGLSSISLFALGYRKTSVWTLILVSALLGLFFATIDPFLHLWDEQYHALVSKNMLKHPLKPTLYDNPILPYDYKDWSANHVWLHKQPLFLWQMALSEFFLGNTALGARFPDVVMHALLTFFVFDIGKMLKNETAGFLAAVIFTFLNYPLDMLSGRQGLDHNDFAFMFYVTASFWAFFRYRHVNKFGWVYCIGIFSGCAILVKWLPGLLIYLPWGILYIIENYRKGLLIKNCKPILTSLLITFLVFVPWQIYCAFQFPQEFKYEMVYNSQHLGKAVESHTGDWTFHFTSLNRLYGQGEIVPLILLAAFLFLFFDKKITRDKKMLLSASIIFVYLFYTIVKTKMTAFPVIVLPLVVVLLGNLFGSAVSLIKNKLARALTLTAFSVLFALLFLDLNQVLKFHTLEYKPEESKGRDVDLAQMAVIQKVKTLIQDEKTLVFNTADMNIKMMYYTGLTAYTFIPAEAECDLLMKEGYKIAVLENGQLPGYILGNRNILRIAH